MSSVVIDLSAPGAAFQYHLKFASSVFDTQCIAAVSLAILLYDYALTFSREVGWIWLAPNKRNISIVLFFLNRYITIFSVPLLIIQYFWENKNPNRLDACIRIVQIHFYALVFSQMIVAAVLIQRAYALYSRSRWVLAGTCTLAALASALGIWAVVTSPPMQHTTRELSRRGTCILPTALSSINRYMPPIIVSIALEVVAFTLTLTKSIQHASSESVLMEVLLGDGIFYFSAVMLTHFGVILSFYLPDDFSRGNFSTLANCLNSALISRLILHLRDPSLFNTRPEGPAPTQDIMSTVVLTDGGVQPTFVTDSSFASKSGSVDYSRGAYTSSEGGSSIHSGDSYSIHSAKRDSYDDRGYWRV